MKPLTFLFLLFVLPLSAQNISGIVNQYSPVTAVNCNEVQVTQPGLFAAGDRVLLIQMQGATVATANTSSFGSVTSYGDAGHYEFANVVNVVGNAVLLQFAVVNSYTPVTGRVQLIRVPQYTSPVVTAQLTCMPWNGTIGGVLVMEVSGTLTLNADIDVSGCGFRGGTQCTNPDGSCGSGYSDFFYPVSSGFGAQKGEGIAVPQNGLDGGRGAWSNGGGGGNKHNSGGGGGSNFSAGGGGGFQANFCPSTAVGGVGGYALSNTGNVVFMGGGGGCSDNNNQVGTTGQNGGGIVIIKAAAVSPNSHTIYANGISCGIIPNFIGDGAGGGGAGGSILLSIGTYNSSIGVQANGGDGGDQNTTYGSCFGPGGGGGVGVVWFSQAALPGNVSVFTTPGAAGVDLYINSQCYQQSYGAQAGASGTGELYNLVLPEGTQPGPAVDLGNDSTLCTGTVVLNAGNPGSTYQWSTGATSQTITVSNGGTYWVMVSNGGGCVSIDTIQFVAGVTVSAGADVVDCSVDSVTLSASGSATNWLWSTGATTSTTTVSANGQYWVTGTANSCNATDTVNVTLEEFVVDLGPDIVSCDSSVLLASPVSGTGYVWSTGDTSAVIAVTVGGTYSVTVSNGNCSATDGVNVDFAGSVVHVHYPNVFTPNRDGINDLFTPLTPSPAAVTLQVFDRWGVRVCATEGVNPTWDGRNADGKDVAEGVYYWIATYEIGCHETTAASNTGFVTILRTPQQ